MVARQVDTDPTLSLPVAAVLGRYGFYAALEHAFDGAGCGKADAPNFDRVIRAATAACTHMVRVRLLHEDAR